jgi:glycosyltransferase involved in cell wall biosynthesis
MNPDVPMQMIENLPLNIDQDFDQIAPEVDKRFSSIKGLSIVYTGTFERYQGVDLLIDSFAQVIRRYPEINLILVGGKPEQIKKYQNMVSEMGLDGSVQFTGIVSLEDANTYIHLADILVSPRIEGTSVPLKIYTYLYAGKPILATNIPAHSLVLSQENACLVDPTPEGMVAGLTRLVEDDQFRAAVSAKSKKLAEQRYGQAQYLSKLENIYQYFNHSKPGMIKLSDKR